MLTRSRLYWAQPPTDAERAQVTDWARGLGCSCQPVEIEVIDREHDGPFTVRVAHRAPCPLSLPRTAA
jgi:hypothetical protein